MFLSGFHTIYINHAHQDVNVCLLHKDFYRDLPIKNRYKLKLQISNFRFAYYHTSYLLCFPNSLETHQQALVDT